MSEGGRDGERDMGGSEEKEMRCGEGQRNETETEMNTATEIASSDEGSGKHVAPREEELKHGGEDVQPLRLTRQPDDRLGLDPPKVNLALPHCVERIGNFRVWGLCRARDGGGWNRAGGGGSSGSVRCWRLGTGQRTARHGKDAALQPPGPLTVL